MDQPYRMSTSLALLLVLAKNVIKLFLFTVCTASALHYFITFTSMF